jgi:hypothetical protein
MIIEVVLLNGSHNPYWNRFLDANDFANTTLDYQIRLLEKLYDAEYVRWYNEKLGEFRPYIKFNTQEGYTEFMLRWS